MRGYSITQALYLPEFKVTQVHHIPDGLRIHVKAHKRKEFVCSQCRQVHLGKVNSCKDVTVEDLKILGKRVWLIVTKRRMRCPVDGRRESLSD